MNLNSLIFLYVFISVVCLGKCISYKPIVLVVSFDGFRRSYMSNISTPIMVSIANSGATTPFLLPAFPTKTFPNHQSICTGLYPSAHGVVDNFLFDSRYSNVTMDGKRYPPGFWNSDPRVMPLTIHNELQGGISGSLMWPGDNQGYGPNNNLKPTYIFPGYNESVPWESRVEMVIGWMKNPDKPANLVYLYYHEPDSTGHWFGPNSPELLEQVRQTDKRVGHLLLKLNSAGLTNKVNLILLSDHGMIEANSSTVINLDTLPGINQMIDRVTAKSPVIQVVPKPGQEENLYKILSDASKTAKFSVFRKSELCGDPYFYCQPNRIFDFVVVADPGYEVRLWNSTQYEDRGVWGNHGYINTDVNMRAILIARGPAFKNSYVTPEPVKNIDVVPLISKIIGISNVPTNGSLSRVEGMLGKIGMGWDRLIV